MSKKIAVTTESAADISSELCRKHKIEIIPMNIVIGEEEYKDGVDLNTSQLYKKSQLYGSPAKTAGVSPYEYKEFFEKLTSDGYDVVHIALSSKISSCFQNASFAARDFENVFVVDSLNLSAGMAMLAFKAAKLRESGKTAKEIAGILESSRTKVSTSFILEDTDYLYRGGRCSALEKFGANLFSIRPSVDIVGGKLLPGKKYKGKIADARLKYIDDKLKENRIINENVCMMNYSGLEKDEVNAIVAHLNESSPFKEIIASEAGCCISAHCGKGCMGIIFETV